MNLVRHALESMYVDRCTVIETREITDPQTKRSRFDTVPVLEDQPCRLSFSSIPAATDGDIAETKQAVKLFLSPDCSILPGSKIVVTQANGTKTEYACSGKPAMHTNHQEVNLTLYERWA